jgi:hypothetical protein
MAALETRHPTHRRLPACRRPSRPVVHQLDDGEVTTVMTISRA